MPVQNPFGLSFSGNITQIDSVNLSPPSAFGTCPGVGCCSETTSVIGVNASLFVGSCTALTATLAGSPPVEALNVNVVNPLTVTFTETSLEVTQGTSPWVVSGTVAISNASICVTQCTSPWVVSGTVTTVPPANASTNITEWNSVALGSPTAWGTAPSGNVIGTNSELFAGGTGLTATGTSLNVNLTGGTVCVTQCTSPWVVSGTVALSGTSTVAGNLTNNNAAPNAFNLGVLPAIAETAYATITYTAGNQVLPVVDLHGAMNVDWQALAGTALGGPTLWATAPTGEQVQGVNAYCVQGTSPWVVSLTSTTITGTVAVTQSGLWTVQQGGAPWTFVGALTNNNAAPAATNIGVLPAIAETAYNTITYTTGDQVLPVTDLHGALNQDLQAVAGVALGATAVVPYGSTPAGVNVPAVNAFITNTPAVTVSGTVAVTQSTSPWVVSLASTTITGTVTTQGNLTNNNAAPNAFNLGVLPAIAEATYTTLAYTTGDQVLPATDSHGALWSDLAAVAGVALGATAVTAFGSAPAAANVPGVNASLFSGTTPLTNTGGALNVNVTNAAGPFTVVGNKTNNNAAPGATNVGVLPALANAASPSWTEGDQVLESVDLTGRQRVRGTLTNNNAAPVADNVGVLPALVAPSDTSFPAYTAGDQVLIVTDTHGNTNTDMQYWGGTDLGVPTNFGTTPGAVIAGSVNSSLFIGTVAAVAASPGVQKVGISGGGGASVDSAAAGGTAPTNALLTSAEYNTTPLVLTNGQAGALQSDTTGALYVNIEGRKQTYSCFATFTPVAGDIAVLPGSASKTIRITRVEVSMSTSGTAGIEAITLVKRSAADTGGTSAAMTAVPHDSNYAAASAAPLRYTAAPTLGTAVGTIRGIQFFDDSNAATGANTWLWSFGDRGGAACIVLRGVAQQLAINLGAAIATQTITVSYEWEEDNS